jgi:beta-mannosidase
VLTDDQIRKDGPPDEAFLEVVLMEEGKLLASDHFFFVDPKNLKLTDVNLIPQIQQKKGKVEVTLSADKLAKNIYLSVMDCDSHFSDNYFDLLPGKKVTVTMDPCGERIITDKDLKIITLNSIINQ